VIAWALRLLPYAAMLGFYLWAQNGWHNNVADRMEKRAVAAEQKLEAAALAAFRQQERWTNVVTAEEKRAKADAAKRAAAALQRRAEDARRDPVSRSVAIPDSARRMLGDAYQAAQAAESASAPTDAAPANSATVADMAAWGISMLDWAEQCRERVFDWEQFYNGLQQ
jgi:hypothetical protein